jgi:uncharacterized protein (TIGR00369 family)
MIQGSKSSEIICEGVDEIQRQQIVAMSQGGFLPFLGITVRFISPAKVIAALTVQEHHLQPWGILHGGVSVALAETVASIGAWLHCSHLGESAVGIEINANHLRPVSSGTIVATAEPIHAGGLVQVWGVSIVAEESGIAITSARCTLLKKSPKGR